ncbi:hypothetical protein QE152_g38861 [Popillia japonica]|uniref:Uncharacterized protein n=1 Tax=Popillia japonica TaxID=7064 RepID=A0AAW1HVE9_POPJA
MYVHSIAKSDNEVTNIDIIQLEERLKRFELVIDVFDQLQTIIETESDSAGAELQERETFENNFYLQVARAKQIIKDNIQSQVKLLTTWSYRQGLPKDYIFRQHRYVVAGDIAKMYRQIKILPEERNLQRIQRKPRK